MILLVGGLAFLNFAPWVAAGVVLLLLVVVASYRQLIKAYPSGGGDYEVARKNIGEGAGVVVAAALLVDYILTVAVSVASGVDNIISAIPELNPYRVWIAVGFVVLLAAVNLRGVRESSKAFAIPTYLFIASIALHGDRRRWSAPRSATRRSPRAPSTTSRRNQLAQAGIILLLLRSFASGCAALTGVEAIANGVPAFRRPKIQNAQKHPGRDGPDRRDALQRARRRRPDLADPLRRECLPPDRVRRVRRRPAGRRIPAPAEPHRPDRGRDVRRRHRVLLHHPGGDGGRAAARGQHRLQRLPAARLGARSGRLRAQVARDPRRPPDLLQRRARPLGGRRAHPDRLPGQRDGAHPALHHRRLHLVHPRPDRHDPALAALAPAGSDRSWRRSGAASASTPSARS